jgi:hypothetical protein
MIGGVRRQHNVRGGQRYWQRHWLDLVRIPVLLFLVSVPHLVVVLFK